MLTQGSAYIGVRRHGETNLSWDAIGALGEVVIEPLHLSLDAAKPTGNCFTFFCEISHRLIETPRY